MAFKINNVPVKKLVEFPRLSETRRKTFANNLKAPKKPKSEDAGGGGDYWVRSTSGLSNAFKYNDNILIKEKIDDVLDAYDLVEIESTKTMYQRNLEILHNYMDHDFSKWRPFGEMEFLAKHKIIISIKDIPIQVFPSNVFIYGNDKRYIGGIWFVSWLEGFRTSDLGVFSECLFRYLSLLYSKDYEVDPNYCITVDISSKETVTYQQILDGHIASLLDSTVDMLNSYL